MSEITMQTGDFFHQPLEIIQQLFANKQLQSHDDVDRIVENLISANEAELQKIPFINEKNSWSLKNGSLVQMRGMIQDMCEPEYGYAEHEIGTASDGNIQRVFTHYMDYLEFPHPVAIEETICRRSLYVCVDVPGESPSSSQHVGLPANTVKRVFSDDDNSAMDDGDAATDAAKRARHHAVSNGSSSACTASMPSKHPAGYLLKFYNVQEDNMRLNDIVDVIGILQYPQPSNSTHNNNTTLPLDENGKALQSDFDAFFGELHPQSFLGSIPRIHVLHIKKDAKFNKHPSDMDSPMLRHQFLEVASKFFGGDRLTAEYFLLHLASHIHGVVETRALGKFDLNIIHCPPIEKQATFAASIYAFVRSLLRRTVLLSLDLDRFCDSIYRPTQSEKDHRLLQGTLQLAPNTRLVINEICMREGTLKERGVHNVAALLEVLETNRLRYEFPYFEKEFEAHYPALILSEGKSMFPATCVVPLLVKTPIDDSALFLDEEFIKKIGDWLAHLKTEEFTIPDEVAECIQKEFAAERQRASQSGKTMISVEILHYELTMARLIALCLGDKSLNMEHWQAMKSLEMERSRRLLDLPISSRSHPSAE